MKWELINNEFTYILRYCLPCLPQFDSEITDKRIDELVAFCKKCDVEAVMFYVDLNPYWYYMADTEEHNEYVVTQVEKAADRLRKEGISYQLNYQNLFGSWDGNYDHTNMYGWECYVDERGCKSKGVACMIGEKFRKSAGAKLLTWAKTKPDVIWIDDDIRLHNHRTYISDLWSGKSNVPTEDFGCFCENHINLFNKKYGLDCSREDIVSARLGNSDDNKIKKQWCEFLNETLCDTAKWIYDTVHTASPDTRIAVMTSNPDVHAIEGRNWNDFLGALTGGDRAILRPHFGPYCEGDPRNFVRAHLYLGHLLTNISSQYNRGLDPCPEIENTRFTRYSKSVAATDFQLVLSAFEGCPGITLSIFDLEGCYLDDEPHYGDMLIRRKALCNKLKAMKLNEYSSDGLAFISTPDRLCDVNFEDGELKNYSCHIPRRYWENMIAKLGIPCKHITPENIDQTECIVLEKESVRQLCENEIKLCLSKSVLADAGAARELQKRGFGEYIGITVGDKVMSVAASEILHTKKRGDGTRVIIPSRIDGGKWSEITADKAQVLSSLVTPGGEEHPGFTFFENSLGGKVCVYAADGDFGDGFCSDFRVDLLRDISQMLQNDIVRIDFPCYGLSSVKKCKNTTAILLANLSADHVKSIRLSFDKKPVSANVVSNNAKIRINGNQIELECDLSIYETAVLSVEF